MYFLFLFRNRNCISYIASLHLPHSHFIKNFTFFPHLTTFWSYFIERNSPASTGKVPVYSLHDIINKILNVIVTGWVPWEADSEVEFSAQDVYQGVIFKGWEGSKRLKEKLSGV